MKGLSTAPLHTKRRYMLCSPSFSVRMMLIERSNRSQDWPKHREACTELWSSDDEGALSDDEGAGQPPGLVPELSSSVPDVSSVFFLRHMTNSTVISDFF